MAMSLQQFGLDHLSRDDRLELLGLIWDSIAEPVPPLPDWHVRELERRRAAAEADPTGGIPWEEFKARQGKDILL